MRRKPAGRHRRHGVVQRVEAAHAERGIDDGADEGNGHVDGKEGARIACDAGEGLVGCVGRFELEEGHAAHAQIRHDEEAEREDPDTAEPVQQRPPHQDSGRRMIETGDDGGARRADRRDRFEEGLREGKIEGRQPERDRADDRGAQPEQVDHEEAHPLVEGRRAGACCSGRGEREAAGKKGGKKEDRRIGVAVIDVDERRDEHRQREVNAADGGDIDGGPEDGGVQGRSSCVPAGSSAVSKGRAAGTGGVRRCDMQ